MKNTVYLKQIFLGLMWSWFCHRAAYVCVPRYKLYPVKRPSITAFGTSGAPPALDTRHVTHEGLRMNWTATGTGRCGL